MQGHSSEESQLPQVQESFSVSGSHEQMAPVLAGLQPQAHSGQAKFG